ncbi:hypothetical protein EB810_11810 [Altererythrobacter sp. FM1]|uniref:hypothetical protein n=1 Tax=Tsuneonella flava TaxID=2055955 RepID=UPI000C7F8A34|nr:hypothetical protein [Tsuneonella flava]ROT93800.1 hypothetical protein EB810_11810 [Altererythrobacter sp. FM1]UBS33075.1 hypothetical protein LBX01_00075 [Altererythrobacter sp. N1]
MTRRQKLIWYALGAFSASTFSVAATLLMQPGPAIDHAAASYLVLEEPISEVTGEKGFDPAFIAYQTGELLRDCEAAYFETTFLYTDHAPTADLPLVKQNLNAIKCVVLRAEEEGIEIRTETRWSGNSTPLRFR